MPQLVLLRHGQSLWNLQNVFTGWVDVPLSQQGISEAQAAGKQLASIDIDCVFTSTLIRARHTAMLVMLEQQTHRVPVIINEDEVIQAKSQIFDQSTLAQTTPTYIDWRLNERFYGELQGLNKAETAKKYGEEQVKLWRRSFDIPPPNGESLKMTLERTLPCFRQRILPHLEKGENVLVSAHGNSLRSIVMHLENLNQEQVLSLEIATGTPRIYQFNQGQYQLQNPL